MVAKHKISIEEATKLINEIMNYNEYNIDNNPIENNLIYIKSDWDIQKKEFINIEQIKEHEEEKVLLFNLPKKIARYIKEQLRILFNNRIKVVSVEFGALFRENDEYEFEIDVKKEKDFKKLFNILEIKKMLPNKIIHGWDECCICENEENTVEALNKGIYSAFYLSKNLMLKKPKHKIRYIFMYPSNNEERKLSETKKAVFEYSLNSAMRGFVKSIRQENPNYIYKTVEFEPITDNLTDKAFQDLFYIIWNEFSESYGKDVEVRYKNNQRMTMKLKKVELQKELMEEMPLKKNGVYMITGGAGEIGIIIAEYLSKNYNANLILIGRSEFDTDRKEKINILRKYKNEVEYTKADITNYKEVLKVVNLTKDRYGRIDGIIHCAGAIRDSLIINKTKNDLDYVLSTKVLGVLNLDKATQNEKLDIIVLFSSIAAVFGNIGQCDYAYANSFLDYFAIERENLRNIGKRSGKTLSINWPLWKDGGMKVDRKEIKYIEKKYGILPLSKREGIKAFKDSMRLPYSQLIIISGKRKEIEKSLFQLESKKTHEISNKRLNRNKKEQDDKLLVMIEEYLKEIISMETKIATGNLDSQDTLDIYGIDSVMIIEMIRKLELKFGELPKTLFFEYQTIKELSEYFFQNYYNKLFEIVSDTNENKKDSDRNYYDSNIKAQDFKLKNRFFKRNNNTDKGNKINDHIAIIGISGKYPKANDLDEYWENLKTGRDCVVEIPSVRWEYHKYFDPDKNKKGKIYNKWGGFIEDVDKFDPLFFNISPREAELIDPQERLFLETVWQTFESSCYKAEDLKKKKVGVFVGVMYGEYQLFCNQGNGSIFSPYTSFASIANRVSYYFDLCGPSVAIDTMCSSSLTSLHLACESIRSKESELAIAGGVNISIHPNKYAVLCQGKFVSSDGKCRSFGDGGDGYVPGEGVGAVFLKPLNKAISDKDFIYGIIKGSGINHNGKTNAYTVPNPNSQADLIVTILNKAGIDPDTIGYIEAHGTGTALGDPIEIAGLTKAFKTYNSDITVDNQSCPIGSIKSNIGHLEAAAGIAGLTKIILQMKNKKLVPSLHSTKINQNINLKSTPFYIQQDLKDWPKKNRNNNGKNVEYPRRAGISSFGAGGSNAFAIIEEYEENDIDKESEKNEKEIIILSARNKAALSEYAEKMSNYLERADGENIKVNGISKQKVSIKQIEEYLVKILAKIIEIDKNEIDKNENFVDYGLDNIKLIEFLNQLNKKLEIEKEQTIFLEYPSIKKLAQYIFKNNRNIIKYNENNEDYNKNKLQTVKLKDIAYTLQTGRSEMEERIAIVTQSVEELKIKLRKFSQNIQKIEGVYCGNARVNDDTRKILFNGNLGNEFIKKIQKNKDYEKIALLWVYGEKVDWSSLNENIKRKKISLPNYPFQKKSYWFNKNTAKDKTINLEDNENKYSIKEKVRTKHSSEEGKSIKEGKYDFYEEVTKNLVEIISNVLKIDKHELNIDKRIDEYGIDSITLTELAEKINEIYNLDLTPAIFYEEENTKIAGLAKNLIDSNNISFNNIAKENNLIEIKGDNILIGDNDHNLDCKIEHNNYEKATVEKKDTESIAVIGMNGIFPMSNDLYSFWENLKNKRNMISLIPKDRWNWESYYGDPVKEKNKTKAKYGGFIEEIDRFDSEFFRISPYEAELMDPQQRIFIQTAWKTIEDAGYRVSDLKDKKAGVFVGVTLADYLLTIKENLDEISAYGSTGISHSILANRISYLFNFNGPSEPIDTACSSSLVAIHRAVNAIKNEECEIAIAGGVNIIVSPFTHLSLSSGGMLADDGKCKTFDKSANGYVRGEGSGAILLKKLEKAKQDNDYIYAVLKGTAVNHGGRANNLTSPNASAQSEVIINAYKKAMFDTRTISYIEAHGTGTSLGDPIEINGLKKAFLEKRNKKMERPYCGIGSVKTNIGHLEAAAGIAGVIKVILAMKNKNIPGILHFNDINPFIKLEKSPFYIVKDTQRWNRLIDHENNKIPRRAGVSSFGFGGVNAHVVIEEHEDIYEEKNEISMLEHIIVLSAKTEERLEVYARDFMDFIDEKSLIGKREYCQECKIEDIAYTLQIGREEMEFRLAIIVKNKKELGNKLKEYLDKSRNINNLFTGKMANGVSAEPKIEKLTKNEINKIIKEKKFQELALLWVSGTEINWTKLYENKFPKRVPLPTYPFKKKRYWVKRSKIQMENKNELNTEIETKNEQISEVKRKDDIYEYEELKNIISNVLRFDKKVLENISENITFDEMAEYGLTSIIFLKLIEEINIKFGLNMNIDDIDKISNLKELIEFIKNNKKEINYKKDNKISGNNNITNKKESINADEDDKYIKKYEKVIENKKDFKFLMLKSNNNFEIETIVCGNGQPLILLNPIDCIATSWMFQINNLSKKYKIIIFNYPGYGRSEFQKEISSLFSIGNIIPQLLEKMKINEKANLVGWSMGGMIGQIIAKNHPDIIKSLTLVNTTYRLDEDDTVGNILKIVTILEKDISALKVNDINIDNMELRECIKGTKSKNVSLHYTREVLNFNFQENITAIKVPTLLIAGGKDMLTPPRYVKYINEKNKNTFYHEFKNGGHYIPIQMPKAFNTKLVNFIKSINNSK